jgi:glutamate-ammonia-ligase adenylyltransferase
MTGRPWRVEFAGEIRAMRDHLQMAAGPADLKRSAGGLVDIEFLVQLLQLKYGRSHPAIVVPNVLDALAALKAERLLAPGEAAALESRYTFLRGVETRLRIVSDRSLSEIPDAPEDREKLARRLGIEAKDGISAGERFLADYQRLTADVRTLFDTITLREA